MTCFDHIRNEDIRDRHVICANENLLAKIGVNIEVDGKRSKGQPKQRWIDTLHRDLKASRLHSDQADHDEPTPLVNGQRLKKKKIDILEKFLI